MARVIGSTNRNINYEVTIKKPLDARSLVKTYEDLLLESNWTKDGKSIAYNGMLVAVANTSDTSKNGLYFLFDINCTTSLKSPNVALESNWLKIGETSEVSDLLERITKIDSELSDINDRLDALEADSTHSYGYRKDFPTDGQQNHIYIANDERRTYIFVGGRYLPIADQFDYIDNDSNPDTPEVRIIYGGSAN